MLRLHCSPAEAYFEIFSLPFRTMNRQTEATRIKFYPIFTIKIDNLRQGFFETKKLVTYFLHAICFVDYLKQILCSKFSFTPLLIPRLILRLGMTKGTKIVALFLEKRRKFIKQSSVIR